MSTRRGFLASILAAGFAPAALGPGILMPVKKIIVPDLVLGRGYTESIFHVDELAYHREAEITDVIVQHIRNLTYQSYRNSGKHQLLGLVT